jgi:hypothetical protein
MVRGLLPGDCKTPARRVNGGKHAAKTRSIFVQSTFSGRFAQNREKAETLWSVSCIRAGGAVAVADQGLNENV